MAQGQRRIRPEFWIILIFVALVLYALIADWWKGHATPGWVIFGIVVAVLAFCLYKKQAFREWALRTIKDAFGGLIHEPAEPRTTSGRDPLPAELREYILGRADNRCENPNCGKRVPLKIHHIDGNHNNNGAKNLIALCGTCHDMAEIREYPPHQLRSWVWKSQGRKRWQRDRANRPKSWH